MEWTGKVDVKAGFVLTLNVAAIATAVALSGDGMVFHGITASGPQATYGFSLLLFIAAALFATWAVAPALRPGKLEEEAKADFIYFGHARYWEAHDLAEVLKEQEPLPIVTRQVVRMAKIAWTKHLLVVLSTWLTGAGVVLLALTGWALS